ncbi:MAG: hypothetical protein KAJ75_03660, partial [Alphaproteobacteria bacterium]|nr:hypothetical protein [Alphaproteobacteria bacterium]
DEPDPRKYVPIKAVEEMQTSLNRIISDRTEEKAVSAVNSAVESGKLQPALKDWGTALHKKDPQAFEDYISKQTGSIAGEDAPSGSPEKGEKSLTDEQKAICSSMGVSEEDYISNLETEENV